MCIAVLGAAWAAPLAAQQDSLYAEIPFQFDVEREASEVLLARTRDSVVYLPLRAVFDLLLIRVDTIIPGLSVRGRFGTPPVVLHLDGANGVALRGRESLPLDSSLVWIGDDPYAATPLVAWLLGASLTVYWSELQIVLEAAEGLPLLQARHRAARRRLLVERRLPGPPPPRLSPRARLADGMVLDWGFTAATRDPANNYGIQLGAGLAVAGGSLTIQHQTSRAPFGRSSETRWSWQTAFPSGWVRQARAGEIGTGGPRSQVVHGAAISNAPFLRPADFGALGMGGTLEPGWEVEVYRGEELIGFTATGEERRWALELPMIYGPNPLTLMAFGPRGETRRRERTMAVPFERLPARRFEYSVGGGACVGFLCDAAANADLRYGVSNRLTIQGGWDRFWRDSLPDLDHPYLFAAGAPLAPLGVQVEWVRRGFALGRLDLDPNPDLHADVTHIRFDSAVAQPVIGSAFVRRSTDLGLFWRPGLGAFTYLQAMASRVEGVGVRRQRARFGMTTRLLGGRVGTALLYEQERLSGSDATDRSGIELTADGVIGVGPEVVRGMYLRAAAVTDCGGVRLRCTRAVRQVTAGLARSLGRSLRLDVAMRRDRGLPGVSIDVTITVSRPWLRATSRNSWVRDLGVAGTQLFEGSILWNRRRGELGLSSGRQLGRGGLEGVVFLDHNLNGRRDAGEPGLPDVLLRVGSDAVSSDSIGRFSVWDLVPFADALVEVDTLGLPNPLWVPAAPVLRVPPGPNSFPVIEVPIQEGAEVSGRAEIDGRAIGGARLIFTHAETGRIRDVVTFGDGTFYLLGLPAGRWQVTGAPGLLQQLRAHTEPLTIQTGGVGAQRVDGVVVRFVRD